MPKTKRNLQVEIAAGNKKFEGMQIACDIPSISSNMQAWLQRFLSTQLEVWKQVKEKTLENPNQMQLSMT